MGNTLRDDVSMVKIAPPTVTRQLSRARWWVHGCDRVTLSEGVWVSTVVSGCIVPVSGCVSHPHTTLFSA